MNMKVSKEFKISKDSILENICTPAECVPFQAFNTREEYILKLIQIRYKSRLQSEQGAGESYRSVL
jgi:hypothetical protein